MFSFCFYQSEIESLNEELKRIQILYNTLQEAESKSSFFFVVCNLKILLMTRQ